jgi:glycosidase
VDAVPYLFEREGTNCENLPETHAFLKRLRAYTEARWPNSVLLAEADQWPEDVVEYFGRGAMSFVKPENRKIFAFTRPYLEDAVLCVFNLSQFAQPVELDLSEYVGATPVEMLGETAFPVVGSQPYQLALAPFGFYWFRLEGAG